MGVISLRKNGNLVGSSFDELFPGSGLVFYAPLNNDTVDYSIYNNTNSLSHGSIIYAHYLFNNNANDSSVNAFNLTANNINYGPGKVGTGSAGYFNGTSSFGSRTSGISLSNRSPQTIAAWIKIDDLSSQRFITSYNGLGTFSVNTSGNLVFNLQGSNSSNTGGGIFTSGSTISTGVWTHVAAVANTNTPTNQAVDLRDADFYINGSLTSKSLSSTTNNTSTNTVFIVGAGSITTGFFSGSIDDVRVYPTILNRFEIGSIYNNGNGIETEIPDEIYVPGVFGSALKLPMNSLVNLQNPTQLQFGSSNDFSLSIWCFPFSSGNKTAGGLFCRSFIAGLDTGGVSGSAITFRMGVRLGGTVALSTSSTYSLGSWFHVVGTSNSVTKQVQIFVNGSAHTAASFSTLNWVNGGVLAIGGTQVLSGNSTAFNGIVDDARVYNRVLGSDEIKQMYLNKAFFKNNSDVYTRELLEAQSLSGSVKMSIRNNNSIYISGELVEN